MSPSFSLFLIHENAFRWMYFTPQSKIFKIFNKIFKANLTKDDLMISCCPCVVSFRQSHFNATFDHAQIVIFCSLSLKIDQASFKMQTFIIKWFWHWVPPSQVQRCPGLPFSAMAHVRPFQALFDPLDTLPCNLSRGRDLQKYYNSDCWKDFFMGFIWNNISFIKILESHHKGHFSSRSPTKEGGEGGF